jgi:DNA-binding SARP family transcriptional activator
VVAAHIRVLGPIEVGDRRGYRPVPGRRARALLAALVLGIDHAVPVGQLVDAVWGEDAPPSARNTLQSHVSTLRSLLGRVAVEYDDDSYRLRVDPVNVDAVRFEQLTAEASDALAAEPERARACAMEGLALWRGSPYGDVGDDEFVELEVRRLVELRLELMETRLEADISLGRFGPASAVLAGLVEDHPFRERLWCLLMSALARDGRRVEAVRAYNRLRELLVEVGLEPSREVTSLYQRILVEAPEMEAHLLHRDP